jgi:hypothetical protein
MKLATTLGIAVLLVALGAPASAGVLLIPDSGADRVWAFDPFDGSLVTTDFIPNHASLSQPINAVDSGHGSILVTDELGDAVLEFNWDGSFIGTFADASDGLDGPFGITVHGNQVYVASIVNGRIVRFDADGSNPTLWAQGFGTPRDIVFRSGDALVSESAGDDVVQLSLGGAFQSIWHNSDGVTGIDFPQQIQLESNGNLLAAGFSPPFGLYVYDAGGFQASAYTNLVTSPRGVYRLGNGQLLYAGGTRIMRYDPGTLTEVTVVNQLGASFRFIEFVEPPPPTPVNSTSWGEIKRLYGR